MGNFSSNKKLNELYRTMSDAGLRLMSACLRASRGEESITMRARSFRYISMEIAEAADLIDKETASLKDDTFNEE